MPNLVEAAPALQEQVWVDVAADVALSPGAFAANEGLRGEPTQEQLAVVAGDAALRPDQIGSEVMAEMPAAHPTIDPAALTVRGLLQKCSHYRAMHQANPEAAEADAAQVVHKVQEVQTMREQGKSDKEIRSKLLADNLARAKERAKAEEKGRQPKPDLVKTDSAEQVEEPATTKLDESAKSGPEKAPVVATRVETADKPEVSPPEIATPSVPSPSAETQIAPPVRASTERVPTQAVQMAQPETVRAAVTAVEVVAVPSTDKLAPAQGTTAIIEAVRDRARPSERLEAVTESTPPSPADYRPSPVFEATTEAESAAVFDAFLPGGDVLPEPSLPGDLAGAAEALADDELTLSLPVIEPGLESGEMAESASATIAKPELPAAPERPTWDAVLKKEPLELYYDFTEALQSLLLPPEEATVTLDKTLETDEPVVLISAIQELQPPPLIVATVAERLAELDVEEKEVVALLLKDIIEAIQAIDDVLLATENAGPETVETPQAKLERLVVILFEQLDIEYEPEDIERFIAVLLRPDFRPLPAEELVPVDLEHEGTREAKLHFAQLVSDGLSDVEEAAEQLLGKLVVFYAAHYNSPEYELVAA